MPRANRHFVPGHIWHITHRCHNKAFLLEHREDRRLWLNWLQKARNRYGLPILDYTVTCNHIHLLVQDPGRPLSIARSMQLVQGRTAQIYNQRKERQSAFWGDRYHATAVERGPHLLRCLAYIDLNMVRAGIVQEPGQWKESGFREIQMDRPRSPVIDLHRLAGLVDATDLDMLRQKHETALHEALERDGTRRDNRWTESLAIGSEEFVDNFASALRARRERGEKPSQGPMPASVLREPKNVSYGDSDSAALTGDNTFEFRVKTGVWEDT
mgnify:CR=1 FL=1